MWGSGAGRGVWERCKGRGEEEYAMDRCEVIRQLVGKCWAVSLCGWRMAERMDRVMRLTA